MENDDGYLCNITRKSNAKRKLPCLTNELVYDIKIIINWNIVIHCHASVEKDDEDVADR